MGTLFEGFQILCTDYDYILEKRGDSIQGRTLFKEIRYVQPKSVKQLSGFALFLIVHYVRCKTQMFFIYIFRILAIKSIDVRWASKNVTKSQTSG